MLTFLVKVLINQFGDANSIWFESTSLKLQETQDENAAFFEHVRIEKDSESKL